MDASNFLEKLGAEGVRFTGRFPVVHVYEGTRKTDQMMGLDEGELNRLAGKADEKSKEAGAPPPVPHIPANTSHSTPNPFAQPSGGEGGGGEVRELYTKAEFDALVGGGAGGGLVVVDFTATWCGPCQRIKPAYHALAEAYPQAFFCKVDVDDNEETAAACKVSSMPTFQFYKDGKLVHTLKGANEPALRQAVDHHA